MDEILRVPGQGQTLQLALHGLAAQARMGEREGPQGRGEVGPLRRGRRHLVDEGGEADPALLGHVLEVGPELLLELDRGADFADAHGLADHATGLSERFGPMRITFESRREVSCRGSNKTSRGFILVNGVAVSGNLVSARKNAACLACRHDTMRAQPRASGRRAARARDADGPFGRARPSHCRLFG